MRTRRLGDAERRIQTIAHVLQIAVNALDKRTIEGRKAKIYHLHITRALEEVALVTESDPPPALTK